MIGAPGKSEWLPKKTETVEYMYGQWKRQTYQEDGAADQDTGAELHQQDQPQAKEEPTQEKKNHWSYQEEQTQTQWREQHQEAQWYMAQNLNWG